MYSNPSEEKRKNFCAQRYMNRQFHSDAELSRGHHTPWPFRSTASANQNRAVFKLRPIMTRHRLWWFLTRSFILGNFGIFIPQRGWIKYSILLLLCITFSNFYMWYKARVSWEQPSASTLSQWCRLGSLSERLSSVQAALTLEISRTPEHHRQPW